MGHLVGKDIFRELGRKIDDLSARTGRGINQFGGYGSCYLEAR
jgi:hypothetical protein